MASFTPSKKTASDFNNNTKYVNYDPALGITGDSPQAETINNLIESALYSQEVAQTAATQSAQSAAEAKKAADAAQTAAQPVNNAWLLQGGAEIPHGADLNDYTIVGNYYCRSNNAEVENCPTTRAFLLKVYDSTGDGSEINQEVIVFDTFQHYVRNLKGGSWIKITVLPNEYLPLSGGTLTGPLTLAKDGSINNFITAGDEINFAGDDSQSATLLLNYRGRSANPITEYKFERGTADHSLSNIVANAFFEGDVRVYSPNNPPLINVNLPIGTMLMTNRAIDASSLGGAWEIKYDLGLPYMGYVYMEKFGIVQKGSSEYNGYAIFSAMTYVKVGD